MTLKGMIRNKHLSKSIADVAWSEFIRQLEYKASMMKQEVQSSELV